MKKTIVLILTLTLLAGAMSVALATDPKMPEELDTFYNNGTPTAMKDIDYDESVPLSVPIDVMGFIGLSNPQYDITLNVSNVVWWADQSTLGAVKSHNYDIVNNSTAFSLLVAFGGFTQGNAEAAAAATNGLTLRLDGALSLDGLTPVPNLATDTLKQGTYISKLDSGIANKWTYSFKGSYPVASLSPKPLLPIYEMTLVFDIAEPGTATQTIPGYTDTIPNP